MTQQGNLLSCSMFKIEDRKTIVTRVLDALLADPDCRYNLGRGQWRQMTVDETANWESRELLIQINRSFPDRASDVGAVGTVPAHPESHIAVEAQ